MRLLIDMVILLVTINFARRHYNILWANEASPKDNDIQSTFSIASKKDCVVESIMFFIVIDDVKNNIVDVYLDIDIKGDYDILVINVPFVISKERNIDNDNEKISLSKGGKNIKIIKKTNLPNNTKIKNLVFRAEISTSKEKSKCKYIFPLYDFHVAGTPYGESKVVKTISNKFYSPIIENISVIFKMLDISYKPDPEKSIPFPSVFLPQEQRWYSSISKNDHSSIYSVFCNFSELEENKRKAFASNVIFTLASSSSVAIFLDALWNIFKLF